MAKFAGGKYALAISDRSGMQFPYLEMVKEWTGAWVHISEFEPMSGVLIRYPFGISTSIIREMAEDVIVYCLVSNNSNF